MIVHCVSLICSNRFWQDRFSLHNALQNPPSTPWLRGYKLLFNSRGIGTSWELPYLWDSFRHSKPSEKPRTVKPKETKKTTSVPWGKWSSIAVRCGYLALNFFILCLYYEYLDLAIHLRVGTSDFAPEKESIVRRALRQYTGHTHGNPITRRELVVRIWTVFDLIIPDYLILSAYHDFFAIMFIATGLDDFWEWPPLFGPISEAYTVRRYWSIFWHRLIYKTFNAHASRILSIFGQRKRTLTSRLLQNFLVFAFSAVMHGAVSWKLGAQCAFDRHLLFWLLQPVPFVIEGLVASFWKRWRLYLLQIFSTSTIAAFERLVGYVWVFAWFFWCAPKGRLPMLSCGRK